MAFQCLNPIFLPTSFTFSVLITPPFFPVDLSTASIVKLRTVLLIFAHDTTSTKATTASKLPTAMFCRYREIFQHFSKIFQKKIYLIIDGFDRLAAVETISADEQTGNLTEPISLLSTFSSSFLKEKMTLNFWYYTGARRTNAKKSLQSPRLPDSSRKDVPSFLRSTSCRAASGDFSTAVSNRLSAKKTRRAYPPSPLRYPAPT